MKKQKQGIQYFRLIAAVMVVAIHTFPFQSFAPLLDTLVTLTLFRVAVPFFFMVSGFYTLAGLVTQKNYSQRLLVRRFLIKQSKLYGWVILLYLPLSFYSRALTLQMPISQWFQQVFFEGTLYHLWYFPAVILGVAFVGFLLNYFSIQRVFVFTFILYLIGLGGDSWSGIFGDLPVMKHFYAILFETIGGTRNGLFFAPFYLVLGAYLASRKETLRVHPIGLSLATLGLLVESFFLHQWSTPRHDSMYFFLPIVLFFLFPLLYQWEPKQKVAQATAFSFGIYVIHPYVIAGIHPFRSLVPLLQNSLIHFLLVLVLSAGLVKLFFIAKPRFFSKKKKENPRSKRILSKQAIQDNLQQVQNRLPKETKVMAVVKANAYGCGAVFFAQTLEQEGVDFFAVATIEEAITLRQAGIKQAILILGYTSPSRVKELKKYDLVQSIVSEAHAHALNEQEVPIPCHLAVDTGMHRLGVRADVQSIKELYHLPYLQIEGIYSHLGSADTLDAAAIERTENQIETYNQLIDQLKARKIAIGLTHLQSSYGILNYNDCEYDYVRPGMLLYGMLSSDQNHSKTTLPLKPVLSLQAQLISKKRVAAGEAIGYGTRTTFDSTCEVGVVSIGYGDGLPRELSNQPFFLTYQDRSLPLIGRVCMDMLLVDLSDCPEIPIEADLTLFTDLAKLADQQETITNELLSQLNTRSPLQVI